MLIYRCIQYRGVEEYKCILDIHLFTYTSSHTPATEPVLQRIHRFPICVFIDQFPQKSPIANGSFAAKDLHQTDLSSVVPTDATLRRHHATLWNQDMGYFFPQMRCFVPQMRCFFENRPAEKSPLGPEGEPIP